MGTVLLVKDTLENDRLLALKYDRAEDLSSKIIAAIKREYLALADLHHPGIAQVYDFDFDGEKSHYFFTSEYIDGMHLLEASRRTRFASSGGFKHFLEIVVQILRALEFIHAHGLLHRDIKPQNIMVTNASFLDGSNSDVPLETKLIDFGLTGQEKQFRERQVAGTPLYAAPETMLGSHLDRRSDLYSLGATLYHLVAGAPPFTGRAKMNIIRQHAVKKPKPPSERQPGLPKALDELLLRLLEKKPANRYQSALEVIQDINATFELSFPLETEETALSYVHSARPVGREKELQALYHAYCFASGLDPKGEEQEPQCAYLGSLTKDGIWSSESVGLAPNETRAVLLRGEKGAGKQQLIRCFRRVAKTMGADFVWIKCARSDEPLSLQSDRSAAAETDDPQQKEKQQLCASLRPIAGMGLEALAALEQSNGPATNAAGEGADALSALASQIIAATGSKPIVLFFQNLTEAGDLTWAFFSSVVLASQAPDSRCLITATAADDALSRLRLTDGDGLEAVTLQLALDRLDREGVLHLLDAMFPGRDFGDSLITKVAKDSDGNPKAVRDLCEFFLKRGCIERTVAGWKGTDVFDLLVVPVSLRQELEQKIRNLPREALRLALAFAYLGYSAELELARELARLSGDDANEGVKILVKQGILEQRHARAPTLGSAGGEEYTFVHSTAQEILYDMVGGEKRRRMHELAGNLCLQYKTDQEDADVRKLAFQFLRARNHTQGLRYGLLAMKDYARELALRRALETYREVVSLLSDDDASVSREVQREVATIHYRMGNFEEAVRTLSDLEAVCVADEDSSDRIPTYLELSKVYMRLGLLHTAEQYRVKAMEGLSSIAGMEADTDTDTDTIYHTTQGIVLHAELSSLQGKYREAIQLCEEALSAAAQVDRPALLASCHMLAADSNFALNNRQECLDHCTAALAILDQHGGGSIADLHAFYQARLVKFSGRLTEALRQFESCYFARRRVEMVDGQAEALMEMGAIEVFLQRAEHGVPFLERATRMFERTGNACSLVKSLNLLGEAYRLSGRYNEAAEVLDTAEAREGMLQEAAEARWETLLLRSRISLGQGNLAAATASLAQAQKALPQNPRSVMKVLHLKSILELRHGDFGAALGYVAAGTEAACKAEDRLCSLRFLEQQIFVYLRLGYVKGAEKLASWLLETARDFDMAAWTGKAVLLEALVRQASGNTEEALRLFNEAEQALSEADGERDVAVLNYYQGLCHFHARDFDQAWLRLQEAMYLAEKLKLSYLRPQILCTLGQIESTIDDGDPAKAEHLLRRAERIAREKSYADVKWRVRYHLGRFLSSQSAKKEATKCLGKALAGLTWVVSRTPPQYHDSFLATFPALKLRPHIDLSRVTVVSTTAIQHG